MESCCRLEPEQEGYRILGSINFDTATHLYKQGLELLANHNEVRLNFKNVSHADSSAIALLLNWLRLAKQQGKSFIFFNLPSQLIEMANVCEVMPIIEGHVQSRQDV